jgi:hypothetical protein
MQAMKIGNIDVEKTTSNSKKFYFVAVQKLYSI